VSHNHEGHEDDIEQHEYNEADDPQALEHVGNYGTRLDPDKFRPIPIR